jgi:hypothetical protein
MRSTPPPVPSKLLPKPCCVIPSFGEGPSGAKPVNFIDVLRGIDSILMDEEMEVLMEVHDLMSRHSLYLIEAKWEGF